MNSDESIAVYIDGDNSSYKNIEIILNEIKSYGRIIILKVYGDWSEVNMKNWLTTASTYGIIPIQCERINGKNSTDIKMCVDLMRDLYNIENISLFYIVTSDSDYRHVISEIKTKNKKINCIGNNNANISLKSICDKYTKIDILISNNTIKNDGNHEENVIKIYSQEIQNLLINNEKINISLVKDLLSRKYNFDLREWGYKKMSKFLSDKFGDKFLVKSNKNGINISYL